MKNLQYLIIFLLVVVIGLQGYYIYSNKHVATTNRADVAKTVPAKLVQPQIKDEDLDKIFTANPFEQMQKMEQNMQKIFNSMNSQFALNSDFEKFFKNEMSISPALDFKSYKDRYELRVSMPGSDKNSIKVTAKDGILSIESRTKREESKNSSNFIKKEVYEGTFARSLSIPSDANIEKMKTKYKNGILSIVIPRK